MRADVRRILVAYDVADDHRRLKIATILASFGDRVQYSVFVVDLSPSAILRLQDRLVSLMDPAEDSVLVCDLGPAADADVKRFVYLGKTRPITDRGGWFL